MTQETKAGGGVVFTCDGALRGIVCEMQESFAKYHKPDPGVDLNAANELDCQPRENIRV